MTWQEMDWTTLFLVIWVPGFLVGFGASSALEMWIDHKQHNSRRQ